MNSGEKRSVVVEAFKKKLDSIETWDEFKQLITLITKDRVKNFIKNNLEQSAQGYRDGATHCTDKASDIDNLVTEVDGI